eukprot:g33284.t1
MLVSDMKQTIHEHANVEEGKEVEVEVVGKGASTGAKMPLARPVVCLETAETYPSITSLAKALGVHESTARKSIRKGYLCAGRHWCFDDVVHEDFVQHVKVSFQCGVSKYEGATCGIGSNMVLIVRFDPALSTHSMAMGCSVGLARFSTCHGGKNPESLTCYVQYTECRDMRRLLIAPHFQLFSASAN